MDVLVTGDTGPLHLAITLQRPTVSLFATADPKWTGPYQDLHLHTIINKKPSPNERLQASMDLITVDEVFNAVNKTLKSE